MSEALWSFENVSLAGRAGVPRVAGVSLLVRAGVTAVIGDSGAGKTSLLNLMTGFETPASGRVRFETPDGERLPMFVVPQDDGLWPGVTVRRHLELVAPGRGDGSREIIPKFKMCATGFASAPHGTSPHRGTGGASGTHRASGTRKSWIDQALADFDLEGVAGAMPESLSRGEAGRVAVARAIASSASVLVLDEPLSHVDSTRRGLYWERLLANCREMRTSLVFASHEPADVLRYSENAIVVRQGRVVYQGGTRALYESPDGPELAAILGPMNWLTAEERARWGVERGREGDGAIGPCVRPEQLSLKTDENSSIAVLESRTAGLFAETDVRCERSGRERRFVHRPNRKRLDVGARVRAVIVGLLALCFLIGCDDGTAGPLLAVESVRAFALPADGAKLPVPRDVAVGEEEEWIILDNAGRVLIYHAAGEIDRQWRMPDSSVGNPEGACLLSGGRIAVADTHYHRVVIFDRQGKVLRMFGELGREPGQFIYPVAVVTDDVGNLYVAEYGGNDRIQKFSPEFEFLTAFGSFGTQTGQFQRPSGMVWSAGKLYVVDAFNSRMHIFSDTGDNLGLLEMGTARLHYPYDIALGPAGLLSIIEYGAGRLTRVTREGHVVGRLGATGAGPRQFATPWGVAVDEAGTIWVADTGNRRIVEIIPERAEIRKITRVNSQPNADVKPVKSH